MSLSSGATPIVSIVQRILPHYRIPFFCELERRLREMGISFQLVYGQERAGSVPRSETLHEAWTHRMSNHYLPVFGGEAVWQPCFRRVLGSRLVIVEQANRFLLNYPLLAARFSRRVKVAYWGHAGSFSVRRGILGEQLQRFLNRRADWWFAYTELSRQALLNGGYPGDRITVLHNAIDTRTLGAAVERYRHLGRTELSRLTKTSGDHVGLFCGGMDAGKELPFLLQACSHIRSKIPDFEMIFLGDGPDAPLVADAASRRSWMKVLGHRAGLDRAPFFAASKAVLMPGKVGLSMVDSLTAGIPLFTTEGGAHGPELAYLKRGETGMITPHDVSAYADAVAAFLLDEAAQRKMARLCRENARELSIEKMAGRFCRGIAACLSRPDRCLGRT